VAELLPQVGGELVRAVDLGRARRDLRGAEGLQGVAQCVDGLAEIEVQAGHVHGSSPLRFCPGAAGGARVDSLWTAPARRWRSLAGGGVRRLPSRLQFVPTGLGFRSMTILTPSPAELTQGRAATPIAFIRAIVLG